MVTLRRIDARVCRQIIQTLTLSVERVHMNHQEKDEITTLM